MFGTPTMGFTLPIYAYDMTMVLVAQSSPTEASTPSPRYDPHGLDFFDNYVGVNNECHGLDSISDEAAMRELSLGVGNLVVRTSWLIDFWFD